MSRNRIRSLQLTWVFLLAALITRVAVDVDLASAQRQRLESQREPSRPSGISPQTVSTEPERTPADTPRSAETEKNNPAPGQPSSDKAQVTGLQFLSATSYSRIMLDLSQETKYEVRRLREDSARGLPPRIYVDIIGAQLAFAAKEPVPVDDGLLRQVRVGQYSADVVRVVLDMQNVAAYHAFTLPDPLRLVIDVQGQRAQDTIAAKEPPANPEPASRKPVGKSAKPAVAPARNSSGIRKIVLDPGHGGKDPGAIGPGGITEKDIVLNVARKLALKLRREMGVQVVLTRQDDRFIPLENRTAVANAEDADLFISLHMNASENTEAKGVETYYLDKTTDEAANRLAARENATSRKNISDLQFILADMKQNVKMEESISLAHHLQGSLVGGMAKVMSDVKDLGVKKAIFHVLVGAYMPCVLVEMGFITHRGEGRSMSRTRYQDAVVEALFEGIQKYGQSNLMARTL
jgi:N-acetylmuramoyl-L-alanine amidase